MYERLLSLIGPLHVVGGLLLFISGFIPPAQLLFESILATEDGFVWSPFFVAVLGPTIASWGVLFSAVLRQFLNTRAPSAWRTLVVSVTLWVPLETALCLQFGFYGGAILCGVMLVVLAILLYGVRPWAHRR